MNLWLRILCNTQVCFISTLYRLHEWCLCMSLYYQSLLWQNCKLSLRRTYVRKEDYTVCYRNLSTLKSINIANVWDFFEDVDIQKKRSIVEIKNTPKVESRLKLIFHLPTHYLFSFFYKAIYKTCTTWLTLHRVWVPFLSVFFRFDYIR